MSAFCTFICTVSLAASYGILKVLRIFNPLRGRWCPEEDYAEVGDQGRRAGLDFVLPFQWREGSKVRVPEEHPSR